MKIRRGDSAQHCAQSELERKDQRQLFVGQCIDLHKNNWKVIHNGDDNNEKERVMEEDALE